MPNWKEEIDRANNEIRRRENQAELATAERRRLEDAKKLPEQQRIQWEKLKTQEHLALVPEVMKRFQVMEFLTTVRDNLWSGTIAPTPVGLMLFFPSWTKSYDERLIDGERYTPSSVDIVPKLSVGYYFTLGAESEIQRRLTIYFSDNDVEREPKCKGALRSAGKGLCNQCTWDINCINLEQNPELVEQKFKNIIPEIAEYRNRHYKKEDFKSPPPPPKQPWYKKIW